MKRIAPIIAAALLGGWTVSVERDRMTDKQMTWASVKDGDATLLFGCLNGEPMPRIVWERRAGWGSGVAVTWRVDDGPVRSHLAGLFSQDGATLYPWVMTPPALAKAKRLRVSVSGSVMDFDLTQGGQGLPAIRC